VHSDDPDCVEWLEDCRIIHVSTGEPDKVTRERQLHSDMRITTQRRAVLCPTDRYGGVGIVAPAAVPVQVTKKTKSNRKGGLLSLSTSRRTRISRSESFVRAFFKLFIILDRLQRYPDLVGHLGGFSEVLGVFFLVTLL
jgi:hypothetical protein